MVKGPRPASGGHQTKKGEEGANNTNTAVQKFTITIRVLGELLHGARTVHARFNVFGICTQLLPRSTDPTEPHPGSQFLHPAAALADILGFFFVLMLVTGPNFCTLQLLLVYQN